jgi:putative transposase
MQNIPKEPMSYKQYKQENELVTKLRIIRRVCSDAWTQENTAVSFACHRNTVSTLVRAFSRLIPIADQQILLTESLSEDRISTLMSPLHDLSTKPHHHPNTASPEQANRVAYIFNELKVKTGSKRLQTILRRKYHDSVDPVESSLSTIGITKLRTICKNKELKKEHAKATNGSYRPLYDYTKLACFEYMHLDTKHILDKKALPPTVYEYFAAHATIIPRYEWNLIDAKSRFRFTAYSYEVNATFGLYFLAFAVGCIRTALNNWEIPIAVGQDNGVEFCSGSPKKAIDWNNTLKPLNASIYTYNPYWDIRKNLIERSHRTDDEEFLIPRGEFIHTEKEFMTEARNYGIYWNTGRSHGGIGMNGRTPIEVIQQSGLMGAGRLEQIPVLILDHHLNTLQECITPLLFTSDIRTTEQKKQQKILDMKTLYDLKSKYFFTEDAQKVLIYYLH